MELVALVFQELQDVQRFQGIQAGDVDLLKLVADLVPIFSPQLGPCRSSCSRRGLTRAVMNIRRKVSRTSRARQRLSVAGSWT